MHMHCLSNLLFFLLLLLSTHLTAHQASALPSTESDPDCFIEECVNVINGDYCECVVDLAIQGPDTLLLQRYHNTKDYITGAHAGGWRIFPERFLILGKDKHTAIDKHGAVRSQAFIGERSGGILTYSGLRDKNGIAKEPFQIDIEKNGVGMVNSYAKEINGQNNHQNNRLWCKKDTCKLILGDGTQRLYQKTSQPPSLSFWAKNSFP
jgi:collagen type I/II/III/V/XI/XXIV/XXVII alpha